MSLRSGRSLASLPLIVGVLCLAQLLGCEGRVSIGTRCAEDASCADGLRCRFGRCRAQCTTANDCTSGAICIGEPGVCTLVTDTCEASCPDGLVCTGSMCAIPCTPVAGCRGGSVCAETSSGSVCIAVSSDAGAPDAPESLDAPEPSDVPEPPDAFVQSDAGPPVAGWERPLRLCAGSAHACAIRDEKVYCWGGNHTSQLGDSTMSSRRDHDGLCGPWDCSDHPEHPVLADTGAGTTTLRGVTAIACGADNTCALLGDGSVWCWGADTSGSGVLGHMGTGSHADRAVAARATSIEVGRFHACARVDGELVCWGANERGGEEDGRLGSAGPSTFTPRAAERFAAAWELALGGLFTCGVGSEGVRCVGRNEGDVTGLGRGGPDPTGNLVPGLPAVLDDLSAGAVFACAIAGGTAHCWGAQTHLVLADTDVPTCFAGSPFFACRASAEAVDRGVGVIGETLVRLSRGQAETMCAVTEGRRVICWGWNGWGQAGLDAPADVGALTSLVQTDADAPLEDVEDVACGAAFCCARTTTDAVHCWGENDFGQLGNGTTDSRDPVVDGGVPDGGTATVALPHPRAVPVDFSRIAP